MTHVVNSLGLSKRKACILVDLSRTAYGYRPHREGDTVLRNRLRELAGQRKRFGSPRLHIMLKRDCRKSPISLKKSRIQGYI